jgi:hypothetical protein
LINLLIKELERSPASNEQTLSDDEPAARSMGEDRTP